jgi:hypothetical protein
MSHEFWCWRCETLELVKFSILDFDKVRGPGDFDVMPCAVFQHLFGLLPKPGQALKIDPSVWEAQCPNGHDLDASMRPTYATEEGDRCAECCALVVYHARIVSVKNLEDAKP